MSQEVRRIFSEKKLPFAVEARGILKDLKSDLGISTLEAVRIFNRYDVSGITDEEYEEAKRVVFSEPPVDNVHLMPAMFSVSRLFRASMIREPILLLSAFSSSHKRKDRWLRLQRSLYSTVL